MQERQNVLTDSDWQYIQPIVDNGRKRKTCLRMVVNGLVHLTRTGTQWRNMDSKYLPHLSIIQYYYYRWQRNGTWQKLLSNLLATFRETNGDKAQPSQVAVDSQSVRSVPFVDACKEIDGNKLVNGRKRHIAVDKHGLPVAIAVTGANINDGQAGLELLWQLEGNERLELFCLDKAYNGEFIESLELYGWRGEIARGRLVKNQTALRDSFPKKGDGR
ncbi:IS5 family transposase [Chondrinema litorale]|uniref:IS5 family transposase n=1 Tax=Chondrinema litorale TaxID=2994555 RepID=UPI0025432E11|nr:IS5 family transposase [Chondrinema litorale]UZS00222.1 IS5 family transposase [Chondrinema litorale]